MTQIIDKIYKKILKKINKDYIIYKDFIWNKRLRKGQNKQVKLLESQIVAEILVR